MSDHAAVPPSGAAARAPDALDDLVRRAQGGDHVAFEWLVRAFQERLFRLAWRMTADRGAAEELTQETFLRAYKALGTFRAGEPFEPWVRAILTHLCLHHLERRRRWPLAAPAADTSAQGEAGKGPDDAAREPRPGPEDEAAAREMEHELARQVASLPPRYRIAFVMRHAEGLTIAQIAAALGRPEATIKTLLFRAREMLRRRLDWQP